MLELAGISCRYGNKTAVDAVSFSVAAGQIACLLGPSGSGKTTLLRAIAGFEPISGGNIKLRGKTVSSAKRCLPPEQRGLSMVFQDYALFPHLTAAQNVAFGLHQLPRAQRQQRVDEQLSAVGLGAEARRYPHELSGGQQQRVALARALAPGHDLVLFDEPFSGLDRELRERLSAELKRLLKTQNATALVVTHDQHEAFALGDVIGVMHDSRLQQWASGYQLYHEPVNRFVADFVGEGSFLPGKLLSPQSAATEIGVVQGEHALTLPIDSTVDVLLRPDDLVPNEHGPLNARVVDKAFRGAETLYTVQLDSGRRLQSLAPSHLERAAGDTMKFKLQAKHLIAFIPD